MTGAGFERFAADGVIDVQAVDIRTSAVDPSDSATTTVDVDVQRLPEGDL